uniref:J domain-containing protein n=1 Tax=Pelusios castaneus TaxID=367368 RepID=A0A8C8S2G3_9SAUR
MEGGARRSVGLTAIGSGSGRGAGRKGMDSTLSPAGLLASGQAEIDNHLEMGRKLLAAGQLAEALSHYHSAVEIDPKNYLTYYKRATIYLAMGKFRSALPDLSKAIELKPDFLARLQRGNILLKQGNTEEAKQDFEAVLNPCSGGERLCAQGCDITGHRLLPPGAQLRSLLWLRALPRGQGRNQGGTGFLETWVLTPRHLPLLSPISRQVRECLKLDQDDKACFAHYKQVKKLSKQLESAEEHVKAQRYEEAIEKYKAAMKTEPQVEVYTTKAKARICHCLSKSKWAQEAIDVCTEAHQRDPRNVFILRDRAEAYILNEEFQKDYQEAKEFDGENEEVKEGLERAQKLLKQSKKRDYYKILGIRRNANKQEIIKAYRKLAQQWHPDNFQSEDEKREAEKKFIDIAAAKEVLTDPGKAWLSPCGPTTLLRLGPAGGLSREYPKQ